MQKEQRRATRANREVAPDYCSGFTLVELLVVVLIIGVLTAVAVPMYQSAVDKSNFSTMIPTARALKEAEEAFLLANNYYTSNEEELDVSAPGGDITYTLETKENEKYKISRLYKQKAQTKQCLFGL